MSGKTVHVLPHVLNRWQVKVGGEKSPRGLFDTKREAENFGRQLSKNLRAEFYIHKRNGQIGDKDSHGNDPCPPPG